jgi:phage shock protein D
MTTPAGGQSMNNNPARTRAGVVLTTLMKIIFTVALTYGPAGAAG